MSSYLSQPPRLARAHGKVILWRDKAEWLFFFFFFLFSWPSFAQHFNKSLKLIGLTPTLLEPVMSLRRADLADFFYTLYNCKAQPHSNRMENVPTPLNN